MGLSPVAALPTAQPMIAPSEMGVSLTRSGPNSSSIPALTPKQPPNLPTSSPNKATAGPPLGPALGPLGINVKAVVDDINKKTAEFNGMSVPVTVMVDDKKNVTLTVGIPPTTALVMKEAGVEKGSGTPNTQAVGNLPLEAVIRIAKMKMESMLSYDLKTAVKEVMGTCVSVGVTVEGKTAKQAIAAVNAGEWDDQLA